MSDKSFTAKDIEGSVVVGGSVNGSINNIRSDAWEKMDIDRSQLIEELSKLRTEMSRRAKNADEYIAVGEVAKAEKAAEGKNLSAILKHLKAAGKWVLDVAQEIGVPIAIEFAKQALLG
jgi:hypothetical protein